VRAAVEQVYGRCDGLAVAGRTDTGVHALANVVSVGVQDGPPVDRAVEALNAVLPTTWRCSRPTRG
jgi:tRNA pseudouridine(38-40) synthase